MEEQNNRDDALLVLSTILFFEFVAIKNVWEKNAFNSVLDLIFGSLIYWIGYSIIWAIIHGIVKYLDKFKLLGKWTGIIYFFIAPLVLILIYALVN